MGKHSGEPTDRPWSDDDGQPPHPDGMPADDGDKPGDKDQ
jgi:hypothetical protein